MLRACVAMQAYPPRAELQVVRIPPAIASSQDGSGGEFSKSGCVPARGRGHSGHTGALRGLGADKVVRGEAGRRLVYTKQREDSL